MDKERTHMNTDSSTPLPRTLVWDLPVRVFHWLMALSFVGAWLSAESERWRLLHVTLGYTMAALVVFRLIWGLVGTRPARFASFVRGPRAVAAYLRALFAGQAPHTPGHNPAGALAILGLLLLILVSVATGVAAYHGLGGEWLEEAHEVVTHALLALVGVHLAGVVLGSLLHRENLVAAMLSGRKRARPEEGARSTWAPLGVLLLVSVLAFWGAQWQHGADLLGGDAGATRAASREGAASRHDEGDEDHHEHRERRRN